MAGVVKTTGKTKEGKARAKLQRTRTSQECRRGQYLEITARRPPKASMKYLKTDIWTAHNSWARSLIPRQELLVSLEVKFHFRPFLVAYNTLIPFNLLLFFCFYLCPSWNILLKLNGNQLTISDPSFKLKQFCKPNYTYLGRGGGERSLEAVSKLLLPWRPLQAYENWEINKGQNHQAHFAHFIRSKEQGKCVMRRNRAGWEVWLIALEFCAFAMQIWGLCSKSCCCNWSRGGLKIYEPKALGITYFCSSEWVPVYRARNLIWGRTGRDIHLPTLKQKTFTSAGIAKSIP